MRPLYIFELDGTLALIDHRRHLVERKGCPGCGGSGQRWNIPTGTGGHDCGECKGSGKVGTPDWPAFFAACVDDAPNWPVIATMHQLIRSGAEVQVWSGRSAVVMNETLTWLHRYVFTDPKRYDPDKVLLTMRLEGDFTPDEQLKTGWYDALSSEDRQRLVAVFDDRDKVVAMWRGKGVACFQVAPGAF
jgi:hypothetical protein